MKKTFREDFEWTHNTLNRFVALLDIWMCIVNTKKNNNCIDYIAVLVYFHIYVLVCVRMCVCIYVCVYITNKYRVPGSLKLRIK